MCRTRQHRMKLKLRITNCHWNTILTWIRVMKLNTSSKVCNLRLLSSALISLTSGTPLSGISKCSSCVLLCSFLFPENLLGSVLDSGAVWVYALALDIALCPWARYVTPTVPLSIQVYKLVLVNCWGNLAMWGSDLRWTSIPSRGRTILLAASYYRKQDELQQPVMAPRLY